MDTGPWGCMCPWWATTCTECGAPIGLIEFDFRGGHQAVRNNPCGHPANVTITYTNSSAF